MTGSTQVTSGSTETKSVFFQVIQPTLVGSSSASTRKILQTRHAALGQSSNNQELLPEEAQRLKNLLLSDMSHQQHSRFNFFKFKRVVVPPVQLPPKLANPHATSDIVAGSRIPVTKGMSMRCRARMMRRLPRRIDERVAW